LNFTIHPAGISYALPANSSGCVSVAFAPFIITTNVTYIATANSNSNDVSLFTLLRGATIDSTIDVNTVPPIGIIVGTTVGSAAVLTGLTIAALIIAGIPYKKNTQGSQEEQSISPWIMISSSFLYHHL
jgi:hypothetical protein